MTRARPGALKRGGMVIAGGMFAIAAAVGGVAFALDRAPAVLLSSQTALVPAAAVQDGSDRPFLSADSFPIMGTQLIARSRGSVVLVHGLGEAEPLFRQWAAALAAASGMNVIGVSLRGNGRSRDTVARRGGPDAYARDIGAVIRELKRRNPSGPVLLLASHGGLGIVSHFATARARLGAPPADGLIAFDAGLGDEARVANGRSLLIYPRRARLAAALASAGISWLAGTVVAEQAGNGIAPVTRWAFAEWETSIPSRERLLLAIEGGNLPVLVVSRAAPPSAAPWNADEGTRAWVQVAGPVDANRPDVAAAITRWMAPYAADAFEPPPPSATQTLDVLGRR